MNPELVEYLFESATRSEFGWRDNASKLLQSASLILRECLGAKERRAEILSGGGRVLSPDDCEVLRNYQLHETGFFLVALASENLLKELWIARSKSKTLHSIQEDLRRLSHNQVRIAKECGLQLSPEEEGLLAQFKDIAEWSGKYHVPLKVEAYTKYAEQGLSSSKLFESATLQDPWSPPVTALFKRLINESKTTEG